jgi:predicted metal-dependent peptidase
MKISFDEYKKILDSLQDYHAVFYNSWRIGTPIFSDSIETACVTFDADGNHVSFLFNPEFWNSCTEYDRLFVICHEILHVILNHGKRFKDAKNKKASNIDMDKSINQSLINRFGFDRKELSIQKDLCWIDTIFKNIISTEETAEFYYNLLKKEDDLKQKSIDDHNFLTEKGFSDSSEIIKNLDNILSDEEKQNIKNYLDKHDAKPYGIDEGYGAGGLFHIASKKECLKPNWENLIKKYIKLVYKQEEHDSDQFVIKNRRYNCVNKNLFIPSESTIQDFVFSKSKIDLVFFLDTSGSCWNLKDRFFKLAESLPKKKFNASLFCFDTLVYQTDIKSKYIYGGGGTRFDIIENYIIKNYEKYPDAVFIISDGEGTQVDPKYPERWYWFIQNFKSWNFVKSMMDSLLPPGCQIHDLNHFQ